MTRKLYISFSSSDSAYNLTVLSSTLDSVYSWFTINRLSVNPSKTEFLLVGTPQQRSKLTAMSVSFCGCFLTLSDSCRNLGVVFDSDLSFKKHICNVCRLFFHHIRQLRQIRSYLDTNSTVILANALLSYKFDHCKSLYYNFPVCSVKRLQVVQNALARVVVPSVKRSHHISPTLRQLHWLPIKQRIDYKIASLTFKTLHFNQPSYLADLLVTETPSRSLRSFSLNNSIQFKCFNQIMSTAWSTSIKYHNQKRNEQNKYTQYKSKNILPHIIMDRCDNVYLLHSWTPSCKNEQRDISWVSFTGIILLWGRGWRSCEWDFNGGGRLWRQWLRPVSQYLVERESSRIFE